MRSVCRYTASGKVVFHAAAVGVVMDKGAGKQMFHIEHLDEIVSMAVHIPKDNSYTYVATVH